MVDRHVDDLVDAYALGALEPEEVDAVERHLDDCPDCRALAEAAREATERLLTATPQVAPPPALKQRVMDRIRAERAQSATSARSDEQRAQPATQPESHLSPEEAPRHHVAPEQLHHHVAPEHVTPTGRFRRAMNILFSAEQQDDAVVGEVLRGLLSEPDCVIWSMAGAPDATARLIGSPSRRDAVIVTSGLQQPEAGQAYQVWFLRDGRPVPNAMFTVDRAGRGSRLVTARVPLAEYDTVAITPEPEEGSLAPTGQIVLAGALTAAAR